MKQGSVFAKSGSPKGRLTGHHSAPLAGSAEAQARRVVGHCTALAEYCCSFRLAFRLGSEACQRESRNSGLSGGNYSEGELLGMHGDHVPLLANSGVFPSQQVLRQNWSHESHTRLVCQQLVCLLVFYLYAHGSYI